MISRMDDASIHLIGLLPPDSVVRALMEVKRRLFRTFSIVSGLAFDPVLPLAYLREPPGAPRRDALPPCPPLATENWQMSRGTLFLAVAPSGYPKALLAAAGIAVPEEGDRAEALPLYPGLYIAAIEERPRRGSWPIGSIDEATGQSPHPQRVIELLGPPPRLRWSSSHLACWALRYRDSDLWWEAVFSEELWRVRLKKEGAAAVTKSDSPP